MTLTSDLYSRFNESPYLKKAILSRYDHNQYLASYIYIRSFRNLLEVCTYFSFKEFLGEFKYWKPSNAKWSLANGTRILNSLLQRLTLIGFGTLPTLGTVIIIRGVHPVSCRPMHLHHSPIQRGPSYLTTSPTYTEHRAPFTSTATRDSTEKPYGRQIIYSSLISHACFIACAALLGYSFRGGVHFCSLIFRTIHNRDLCTASCRFAASDRYFCWMQFWWCIRVECSINCSINRRNVWVFTPHDENRTLVFEWECANWRLKIYAFCQ